MKQKRTKWNRQRPTKMCWHSSSLFVISNKLRRFLVDIHSTSRATDQAEFWPAQESHQHLETSDECEFSLISASIFGEIFCPSEHSSLVRVQICRNCGHERRNKSWLKLIIQRFKTKFYVVVSNLLWVVLHINSSLAIDNELETDSTHPRVPNTAENVHESSQLCLRVNEN